MPEILDTSKPAIPDTKNMMLGEQHRPDQTVHVPPWTFLPDDGPDLGFFSAGNDTAASDYSPCHLQEALTALQRYLPSNELDFDTSSEISGLEPDSSSDTYSCDQFRMYEFKVRRCARGRSHDWTECPYAHPGEKARRRDPRKYHYSGTACPDFRKGACKKGDACEFAHGVFECWLHPARYRTQPCKDGVSCRRRVCFFAHTQEQLRVLPKSSSRTVNSAESYDGSPLRQALEASGSRTLTFLPSTDTVSPVDESPPMSPAALSRSLGSTSNNEMVASLRNLQLGKGKSLPTAWHVQVGASGATTSSAFGSPRASMLRPGFCSLPATPTAPVRASLGYSDFWDTVSEEPAMERVESGRDLRAKRYEKLSKENSLDRVDSDPGQSSTGPDFEWVSELVM